MKFSTGGAVITDSPKPASDFETAFAAAEAELQRLTQSSKEVAASDRRNSELKAENAELAASNAMLRAANAKMRTDARDLAKAARDFVKALDR